MWIRGSYSGVGEGGQHPQSETRLREGKMKGVENRVAANEGVASRQKLHPRLGTDS